MNTGIKATILAGAALVMTFGAAAQDKKAHNYAANMHGSWTSEISIRNCATGDVLAGPLPGLTTFHRGGTLSETRVSNPMNPRGPGHGIWYRAGKHQFMVKIVFQRFDLNGFLIGTQEVSSLNEVAKGSDSLVTNASFKVLDLSGATLASGCASGESQRIQP